MSCLVNRMTGYTSMDQSPPAKMEVNGVDPGEFDVRSTSFAEYEVTEGTIATLDVTPEEINLCQSCWKSPAQHCQPHSCEDGKCVDYLDGRRRSETWSPGNNEMSQTIKSSNTFHSDISLNHSNLTTKHYNGFTVEKDNLQNSEDDLRKRSLTPSEKNMSSHKDQLHVSDSATLHDKRTPVVSSFASSSNALNHELNDLDINCDDGQSEFTDINLQPNGMDECDDSADAAYEQPLSHVKHSGKPSIGSLFGWISSPKNSSVTSSSNSVQNSPAKDSPNSNSVAESVTDTSLPTTHTYHTGEGSPGHNNDPLSIHADTTDTLGIKNIGKSLRSSFASKSRFWRGKGSEPLSTTALILENRPSHLPLKSAEEAERHRNEYEKMVENAKKHELRDVQKRKKQLKQQRKYEESIASTSVVWTNDILPNWASVHQTNRVRQLWWQGLPPNVRGKVWQLAIGNELNITEDLYDIMVTRAHDKLRSMNETQSMGEDTESLAADRECTVELIRLDISRTFPHLCIFQKGGPYHDLLHDILGAYVCYRPDVGYVQGMSFMAAMLLLNMEPAEAFATFANLLNKPCQVAFFRLNEELMKTYFATFEVFFEENLPKLFAHFKQHNLTPDMYLIDWIFTMYSKALSLDAACRVWDVFCRDGEDFLFKTAIAILKLHEDLLLHMEFIYAAQFLSRLPGDFTHQRLFSHAADVIMVSRGNRRWKDVLSLMKDGS